MSVFGKILQGFVQLIKSQHFNMTNTTISDFYIQMTYQPGRLVEEQKLNHITPGLHNIPFYTFTFTTLNN